MNDDGPLQSRRRRSEEAEMFDITSNMKEKEIILIGDSIIKNLEKFAPNYSRLFPASTVLNAGIPGYCSTLWN